MLLVQGDLLVATTKEKGYKLLVWGELLVVIMKDRGYGISSGRPVSTMKGYN